VLGVCHEVAGYATCRLCTPELKRVRHKNGVTNVFAKDVTSSALIF
jgi:hypothetical protein